MRMLAARSVVFALLAMACSPPPGSEGDARDGGDHDGSARGTEDSGRSTLPGDGGGEDAGGDRDDGGVDRDDGGGDRDDDGGGRDDDGGEDVDVRRWTIERATTEASSYARDGALAVTDDGATWAAFVDGSDPWADLRVARRSPAGGWSAVAAPETGAVGDEDQPTMSTDGVALDLVWSGVTEDRNRSGYRNILWYSRHDGSGWSAPVDLVDRYEIGSDRLVEEPIIARKPSGALALAYQAYTWMAGAIGPYVVKLATIEDGALVGEPATPFAAECNARPALAVDAAGTTHAVTRCGAFPWDIAYTHDAGGSWAEPVLLPGSDENTDMAPAIAVAPDGTVLVAWTAQRACDIGACTAVMVSERRGHGFDEPIMISGDHRDAQPQLAVDGDGALHVAFTRLDRAGEDDVDVVVVSRDTEGALHEEVLTPDMPGSGLAEVYGTTIDGEGRPHFGFTLGSSPLDLWYARMR
jgi:hypothetical protein